MFPGSQTQWNGVTDMTDAGLLAEQMHWAATTPAAADTAFNVANGDVFRWRWMWPRLAARLGVRPVGYDGQPRPLEEQMAGAGTGVGRARRPRAGCAETRPRPGRVVVAHRRRPRPRHGVPHRHARSRAAGFTGYRSTLTCFLDLFDRLDRERIVPLPATSDSRQA